MTIDTSANYIATIRTNMGNIVIELFATAAPETVNNFVFLAKEGFYDDAIFHRVIENFMIQGGDPTGTGSGGPGYNFKDEIDPSLVFDRPGILAMANAGPNTNGSQFFIPTPHLNGAHTIFGQVLEGQGIADTISKVPADARSRPTQPVTIDSIEISKTSTRAAPTPAPTPKSTSTPAKTPTPTNTSVAPAACQSMPPPTTVLPAGTDGLYTGPLFDTHLHIRPTVTRILGSADALCRYLQKNQVAWAIGFYFLRPEPDSEAHQRAMQFIEGSRSRVVSLLRPDEELFRQRGYTESLLQSYLEPAGALQGVGEIGLYKEVYQSLTFESPQTQTVFQEVNSMKGVVMIHPSGEPEGRKMELTEIEPSISRYPNINFLFHGHLNLFDLVSPLMSKYANVYYTWDRASIVPKPTGNLLKLDSAEDFIAEVNRIGIDTILEAALDRDIARIEQHPKRVMWGTDRTEAWHFEEDATELILTIHRRFIARLPRELQEDYAFRNAWRIFGGYLTASP